jgi:hypothetical protein
MMAHWIPPPYKDPPHLASIAESLGAISKRLAFAFPHPKDFATVACPGCAKLREQVEDLTVKVRIEAGMNDRLIGRAPRLRWTFDPPNCVGLWAQRRRIFSGWQYLDGEPHWSDWQEVRLFHVTVDGDDHPGAFRKSMGAQYCLLVIEEPLERMPTAGADAADPVVKPVNTGVGPGH